MADALAAPRPQATYGRKKTFISSSDDEESHLPQDVAASSSSPRLTLFDSSPSAVTKRSAMSKGAAATGEDGDTGNTTPDSSDAESAPVTKTKVVSHTGMTPAMRLAKAMRDTDSDLSEEEPASDTGSSQGADAVARLRAKMGRASASYASLNSSKKSSTRSLGDSNQYTSSLSSAPPLSSDDHRTHDKIGPDPSSGSEADSEAFASALMRAGRRGATAGRMKKRELQQSSSSSLALPQPASSILARKSTPAVLHFSSDEAASQSPSSSAADLRAARAQSEAAMVRQKRLAEMAAKKRVASPSLEEEFFSEKAKHAQRGDSMADGHISSDINGDESDSSDLPSARELLSKAATSSKQSHSRDKPSRHTRKERRTSSKGERAPKAPKQLSKKEMEEVHKTDAKIERNKILNVPSLSRPAQRQKFDLSTLAAMFNPANTIKHGAETSLDVDLDVDADPIETETPKANRSATGYGMQEDHYPSNRVLGYGRLIDPSVRPKTKVVPSSDSIEADDDVAHVQSEEQLQQAARDLALRKKKERWLEAQKKLQPPKLATNTRAPSKEELVESLQVVGKPTPRARPKPVVGLAATSLMNAAIQEKIRKQNVLARKAREASSRHQGSAQQLQQQRLTSRDAGTEEPDDSMGALQRIQERVDRQNGQGHGNDEGSTSDHNEDEDEDDEDFVLDGGDEGSEEEEAIKSDVDEQHASRGSASEYDEEEMMPRSSQQPPPSSQNTNRSYESSSRQVARDGDEDDEDDEVDVTFTVNRAARARRAVLDDEDVESSESRHRESESTDEIQNSREKVDLDAQRQDNPSGLRQFLGGFAASPTALSPLRPLQLATQAATSRHIQIPPATGNLGRAPSDDSVLGQFFQETQLSEDPRGFSLDVIGATGRARNAENAPFLPASLGNGDNGFSQFFHEGTQLPSAGTTAAADSSSIGPSQLMGPPTILPADGFAALRRAAHDEAGMADPASPLPSNDGFDDDEEEELYLAAGPVHAHNSIPSVQRTTPKQYLNRDGFFTQTKPVFEGIPSSQSQSQLSQINSVERDQMAVRLRSSAGEGEADADADVNADGSPRAARKKRFRRALQPAGEDEEEEEAEVSQQEEPNEAVSDEAGSGSEAEGDDEDEAERVADAAGSGSDEEEQGNIAGALHPGATRNAWDILRQGQARAEVLAAAGFRQQQGKKRQRDYQFIEGEAEESDEDGEGRNNRKGAGGLDGVFSDSNSDGEGEEDEEDDDGRDLEELVNNERELDEAEKDVLARERYQKDLDADDEAAMALADKAARGDLRNKRRLRDGDRLEDLLDDDFDEERLMRKANNPRAMVAKRRKIEGDEMELLAAKEESQAFVRGYSETHRADVGDDYNFLAEADTDEDAGDDAQDEEQSDEEESASSGSSTSYHDHGEATGQRVRFQQDEQDDDDEEAAPMVQRVTRKQLARELRERRRRRKQGIVSSDEEGHDVRKPPRDPLNSDDSDDEEVNTSDFIRDRLAATSGKPGYALRLQQEPEQQHSTGLHPTSRKTVVPSMFNRRQEGIAVIIPREAGADDHDDDDDDDDDDARSIDPSAAIQARLLRRQASRRATGTSYRLAKLAEEFTSEPDFAAGRSRCTVGGGASGARVTSWGQQAGPGSGGTKPGADSRSNASHAIHGGRSCAVTTTKTALDRTVVLGRAILAERRVEESQ